MKKHIFNFDKKIFVLIDQLKTRAEYKKFQETLGLIDDDYQAPLGMVSTLLFIFLPFIGMWFLSGEISNLTNKIELRQEYIRTAGELFGNKEIVTLAAPQVFSTFDVSNFSSFQSLISRVAQTNSIDSTKIKLSGYDSLVMGSDIRRSEVMIQLKEFTNLEMTNLLNGLLVREKIRVASMDLKRNEKSGRIDGVMKLVHFGKNANIEMTEE